MPETDQNLGKLESVYGISPVYLQRAFVVIILSFIFFLAMLIAFSLRQQIGYFILSTAFLIVNIFMLFGWMTQRKKVVKIYANGFTFKNQTCKFNEIEKVYLKQTSKIIGGKKTEGEIIKTGGEKIILPEAIYKMGEIVDKIEKKSAREGVENIDQTN